MEFQKGPFSNRGGAQTNQYFSVFEREERKDNPNNPYNLDESVGQLLNRTFANNSIESSYYHWDHDESNLLENLDQIKQEQMAQKNAQIINKQNLEQNFLDTMMQQQQKKTLPERKVPSNQNMANEQIQKKEKTQNNDQGFQLKHQSSQKKPTQILNQFSSSFLPHGKDDKLGETVISEYVSEDFHSQHASPIKEGGGIALMTYPSSGGQVNQNQLSVLVSQLEDNIQSISHERNELSVLSILKEQEFEKPIYLNAIIVGAQGLGKSTFIDAFLNKKFKKEDDVIRPKTQQIVEVKGKRKESKINLNLNMVDTPGYTEQTNIDDWLQTIIDFVSLKFEKYSQHEEEQFKDRKSVQQEDDKDCRIHVCLYFMQGPRISESDLKAMLRLQDYLNIIPILAKGDCYTPEEVKQIKENITQDFYNNKIQLFDCEAPLDKERLQKLKNGPFGPAPPFLMISSVQKIEIEKQKFQYARKYPWGICRIEDPEHSDFLLLYQLLIGFYIPDLKKLTEFNYKKYQKETKKAAKQLKQKERQNKNTKLITSGFLAAIGGIGVFSFFRFK